MIKSMILALCVLGMSQAAEIPTEKNKNSSLEIPGCRLHRKRTTGTVSYLQDWSHACRPIGGLVENFKSSIVNLDWSYNYGKIAAESGNLLAEIRNSTHWKEVLGDGTGAVVYEFVDLLFFKFKNARHDRSKRETEEGVRLIKKMELILLNERNSAKKVAAIKLLFSRLAKIAEVMKAVVKKESTKTIYDYVCKLPDALAERPPNFTEKDVEKSNEQSVQDESCSGNTFNELRSILIKGHQFLAGFEKIINIESVETVEDVAKNLIVCYETKCWNQM